MSGSATENLHPAAMGLDALAGDKVLAHLMRAQIAATEVVAQALPQIEAGARMMAAALRGSGRLIYVGAGSSALMANADAMELPGTFGVDPSRLMLCMAGGIPTDAHMPGDTEDDVDEGARVGATLAPEDVVIAVSASGRTPYPLALAKAARTRGAQVIAITNNAGAPLFELAQVAICLPTPPEVIAGSTRMGAATAQKVALNMMSTRMGILLGQVHDGMMVGVIADNAKLRARATGMVRQIAGVADAVAAQSLAAAEGEVKPAVLIALGAPLATARQLLSETEGNLRAAMARLKPSIPTTAKTRPTKGD